MQCLVFPFGGETRWIDLSLRDYPELNWVVLVADDAVILKDEACGKETTYYEAALGYATRKNAEEANIPIPKRCRYTVLNILKYEHNYEYYAYFHALFEAILAKGYPQIFINLSSALMAWRIALYQSAIDFSRQIVPFLYNKKSGEKERIPIFRPLSKMETSLIQILCESGSLPLSNLWQQYSTQIEKCTLSYVVKKVNQLQELDLVSTLKAGRIKHVSLTPTGMEIYCSQSKLKYKTLIAREMENP